MKVWAYVALLLIVIGLGVVVAVQDHKTAEEAQRAASQPRNGASPVETDEQAAEAYIKNSERTEPVWYRFVRWPEGIGAWFVLLTLFAIADQSYQTKRAADAANIAAKFAKEMQKKERANFSIDRVIPPEEREYQWPGTNREPGSPKITITNQGPTYAFEVSCQCAYFASRERVLSRVPRLYSESIPTTFKSGEQHTIEWEMPIPLTTDAPGDSDAPIRDEQAFLHVYVTVSYRDVFGKLPDAVLHLLWKIDIETIETGVGEYPEQENDYSKWIRVDGPFG